MGHEQHGCIGALLLGNFAKQGIKPMIRVLLIGALLCSPIQARSGTNKIMDVPINIFARLYDEAATKCDATNDCEDQEMLFAVMKLNNWCVRPNNGHQIAKCPR